MTPTCSGRQAATLAVHALDECITSTGALVIESEAH